MKSFKSIQNLKNKKVLVRVDFNAPVGDDGTIDSKEDWRIRVALPAIEYLAKKGAKIVLITHLGRPEASRKIISGAVADSRRSLSRALIRDRNDKAVKYSLKPVAKHLEKLLNREVKFINNCVGEKIEKAVGKIKAGEIIMLENLRFHQGEKNNDEEFARELSKLADIYINNAFSVSHRRHASVCAITNFLPSYAGLLLEKEISVLSKAINNPEKPATIIIGGAKVKTKVPVIEYLLNKFDNILTGGVVANVILKAKGINTGSSLLGDIDLDKVKKISFGDNKLRIPVDAVACNNKNKVFLSAIGKIGDNKILDIGPETAKLYSKIISDSKTIIWNGPMGLFEKEDFSSGTKAISKAVAKAEGWTIIGGGDTIAAADKFEDLKKINYVCAGGGAMLEFLAGKKLPGLEALK